MWTEDLGPNNEEIIRGYDIPGFKLQIGIDHPFILKGFEVFEEEKKLNFVTQYVGTKTLFQRKG